MESAFASPVGCGLPVADVAEGNSTDRHGSGDGGTAAKADVTEGLYFGNFLFWHSLHSEFRIPNYL
ncbi:MAG: hypothetical protein IIY78_05330 [Clostridia bacterium]|nr:hypothetical protein [Clostridia bacterium]